MKDYSDGIFGNKGDIVGYLDTGDDEISLRKGGHNFFGCLNNRRITESKSPKEFMEKAAPVLAMVTASFCPKSPFKINAYWSKEANSGMLDSILDAIRKNRENLEVAVLTYYPDEITQNKPKDLQAFDDREMVSRVAAYAKDMKDFYDIIDEMNKLATILLRTKFSSSMWGAKDVHKILAKIPNEIESAASDFIVDHYKEDSEKHAGRILLASRDPNLFRRANIPAMAGHLIKNFFVLKRAMSNIAQIYHPLYRIDAAFKKYTGYPTTWFFNSSVFYDYLYNYDNHVNNLAKMAKIESDTIEPLFAWKVKTGERNVR